MTDFDWFLLNNWDWICTIWISLGTIGGIALKDWSITDFLDDDIGMFFYLLLGPFIWIMVIYTYFSTGRK